MVRYSKNQSLMHSMKLVIVLLTSCFNIDMIILRVCALITNCNHNHNQILVIMCNRYHYKKVQFNQN